MMKDFSHHFFISALDNETEVEKVLVTSCSGGGISLASFRIRSGFRRRFSASGGCHETG
jgi:hypothetical protein